MGLFEDYLKHIPPDFKLIVTDNNDNSEALSVHRNVLIASSAYFQKHIYGNKYYIYNILVDNIDDVKQILQWMYHRQIVPYTDSISNLASQLGCSITFDFETIDSTPTCTNPPVRKTYNTRSRRMILRSGLRL